MSSAVEQLIELAERLQPAGVIGDGMVAQFHALAARARLEQRPQIDNVVESGPPRIPYYGDPGPPPPPQHRNCRYRR